MSMATGCEPTAERQKTAMDMCMQSSGTRAMRAMQATLAMPAMFMGLMGLMGMGMAMAMGTRAGTMGMDVMDICTFWVDATTTATARTCPS